MDDNNFHHGWEKFVKNSNQVWEIGMIGYKVTAVQKTEKPVTELKKSESKPKPPIEVKSILYDRKKVTAQLN